MSWLNKLERRIGRYAIPNLIGWVVGGQALTFLLMRTHGVYDILTHLAFSAHLIAQGQVWRLLTFVFIPPSTSLFVVFALYLLYLYGSRLEQEWGSLRVNIYYGTGVLATLLAAEAGGGLATASFINLSVFFAFATLDPDFTLLLFFVLPVKVKYLAWMGWGYVIAVLMLGALPTQLLVAASLVNYFAFFGRDIIRRWKTRTQVYGRRRAFATRIAPLQGATMHRCAVCGMTEQDDPRMDFRYCRACGGQHEYCATHLPTHTHQPPQPDGDPR